MSHVSGSLILTRAIYIFIPHYVLTSSSRGEPAARSIKLKYTRDDSNGRDTLSHDKLSVSSGEAQVLHISLHDFTVDQKTSIHLAPVLLFQTYETCISFVDARLPVCCCVNATTSLRRLRAADIAQHIALQNLNLKAYCKHHDELEEDDSFAISTGHVGEM